MQTYNDIVWAWSKLPAWPCRVTTHRTVKPCDQAYKRQCSAAGKSTIKPYNSVLIYWDLTSSFFLPCRFKIPATAITRAAAAKTAGNIFFKLSIHIHLCCFLNYNRAWWLFCDLNMTNSSLKIWPSIRAVLGAKFKVVTGGRAQSYTYRSINLTKTSAAILMQYTIKSACTFRKVRFLNFI